MAHLNSNYLKLKAGYLFPEINRRVKAFTDAHPDGAARLIRCGIGDVTEPLPVAVREAYVTAATARGDKARVVTIVGDGHFEAMTPYKAAGRAVIDAIRGLLDLPPSTP